MAYKWDIQGNYGYGHGWETENTESTRKDAVRSLREYRENGPGQYRMRRKFIREYFYLRSGADYLADAVKYKSKGAAVAAYADAARELAQYGQSHDATIHIATDLDALQEYPDFILSMGPRGGIRCEGA